MPGSFRSDVLGRTFLSARAVSWGGACLLFLGGMTGCNGCNSSNTPAPIVGNNVAADQGGPDPATANMASGQGASYGQTSQGQPTQVLGQSQSYTPEQQGEYPQGEQAPAPIVQGNSGYYQGNSGYYDNGQGNYDQGYADGEAAEASSAPPPLPEYEQPAAPDPNDIWTPGYWNYGDSGYYWVPGTWVAAPYYGALWTPPYWGYYGGHYRFHHGYWGPHVGFYGGINYGFGYIGVGYFGGYWHGHDFYYNRAVNRVGPSFTNVYDRTVVYNNVTYNRYTSVRTSYNGGPGGIDRRPQPFEIAADHERHAGPLPQQQALRQQAFQNRANFFAQNQGRPQQAAFVHPPDAHRALPANTPPLAPNAGVNRPGSPDVRGGQPANRPGQPGNVPFDRPGQPFNHGGDRGSQPGNRPGEPGNQPFGRPGQPNAPEAQHLNRPGQPANEPFNRPGAPNTHIGTPAGTPNTHIGTPAGTPNTHIGTPAQPRFNRPTAPAGGFNRGPQGGFHPGGPTPGAGRPAPAAAAPHIEAARPAPAPHVEAPRAAPAPHVEAPRAAPAPAPHAAPTPAAPHGGGPGGGGHPGPR